MAIRYIKDHFKEPIRVNDVVEAIPLSRRVLENRFRKTIARSINSEIRRIRVEYIASLLVETNKPISQIGLSMGFSSIDHISRYFKAEKGISLQEFRNRFGKK
jgi:LacI family transcriptional regulator